MSGNGRSEITGVILAGGKSSRMGRNKALLPVGGVPCVQRIAEALRGVCGDILIVSDDPTPYAFLSLPVIPDRFPGSGPLAGIHSALSVVATEKALILACDLPHVSAEFLRRLCAMSAGEDALVPLSADGRLQPLCAIYRTTCVATLEEDLKRGRRSVLSYLEGRNVRTVPAESLLGGAARPDFLANMNTPDDYARETLPTPAAPPQLPRR
jgi:molybdopterin-guanine dinucleotide biosynthesis protein A